MEAKDWVVALTTVMVALAGGLGGAGWINYRAQKRRLNSDSDVADANAQLIEGQLTIQVSQEARQLLSLYRTDSIDARSEAAEAKRIAVIDRRRTEFLIEYLRTQGIAVPEFPEALR